MLSFALAVGALLPPLPAQKSGPDLRILALDESGLSGDWQTLQIWGTLAVEVENAGNAPAAGPIKVVLYEDLDGDQVYSVKNDRLLGAEACPGSLAPGAAVTIRTPVLGSVRFRQNLIYAWVDYENVAAESDEVNNFAHTGLDCIQPPPEIVFNPVVKWHWNGLPANPFQTNVQMTPAVADVTGPTGMPDGHPDILFVSTDAYFTGSGPLQCIDGETGLNWFTADSHYLSASDSLAIGDVDEDGLPEIVGVGWNSVPVIFEHDGTFKLSGPTALYDPVFSTNSLTYGAVNLCNIDQSGPPELLIGRYACNNDGTIRWTGTRGAGQPYAGRWGYVMGHSFGVDLDQDGDVEVLAGNTVYDHLGNIQVALAADDGFVAVADFDDDVQGELVHVSNGFVRVFEHDGALKWGPVEIPKLGNTVADIDNFGGPPTVADFDNDGEPEIGVVGAYSYNVFEPGLSVRWSLRVDDWSSFATGSSVFDFEADGVAEVVYRDQFFLRVLRGSDGQVQFALPMSSCTWTEYVLVADVDNDHHAEVVSGANWSCGLGPQTGLYLIENAEDNWVRTRPLWNQHAYHVTNVNDDLTIPVHPVTNWRTPANKPFNNFRQNLPGNGEDPLALADLTASYLRFSCDSEGVHATVRVGNGGAASAPAGFTVAFYDGDPTAGGSLLGSGATASLAPGAFEDVSITFPPAGTTRLCVVVDEAHLGGGAVAECDETNNTHHANYTAPQLVLTNPNPGQVGRLNTLSVSGATPLSQIGFYGSCRDGRAPVRHCDDLFLGLHNPILLGVVPATDAGVATLAAFVPPRFANETYLFQAVQFDCCALSNRISFRFQ